VQWRLGRAAPGLKKERRTPMINNFQDFQKMGQTGMDGYLKMMGEWNKSWQAIASEMTDYSKRAFEEGTSTFEKLVAAKTVEQAVEIQTNYAKRAYEDYMQQLSKIGSMYQSFAKDAFKPVERVFPGPR
jgi:tRNA splicing ligase